MRTRMIQTVGFGLAGILLLGLLGCGKETDQNAPQATPAAAKKPTDQNAPQATPAAAKKPHDHSDWWCEEHGIPEEICGLCNKTYAAECRRKEDWCNAHERPRSQCFLCEPALKEKFAERYRARYKKDPPPITAE